MTTHDARLERLFRDHHQSVRRFALSRAPHVADDVVSETFAIAVRRQDAIPADAELSWLLGVAKNVMRDHARSERRAAGFVSEIAPRAATTTPGPEPVAIGAAMNDLPESERAVLALTGIEGLSSSEAAERLGMTPGSARNMMVRARKNLAVQLVAFGMLATLAILVVVLRKDHPATDGVRQLAQRLSGGGRVSARVHPEGQPQAVTYTLDADRAVGTQRFDIGDGITRRGRIGGVLRTTSPAGLPGAVVSDRVHDSRAAVAAMRTVTEGQVQQLVNAAAAGRARIRTRGDQQQISGNVTAYRGQRLAMRVTVGARDGNLRRVSIRRAGTSGHWVTITIGNWHITRPAPPAEAPAIQQPNAKPSTPKARKPRRGRTPETVLARRTGVTAAQARRNRAVVATTPKYSGPTGTVLYERVSYVDTWHGKATGWSEGWYEQQGGRRTHEVAYVTTADGTSLRTDESWNTPNYWVHRGFRNNGRTPDTPRVYVRPTCGIPQPAKPAKFAQYADFSKMASGSRVRGRATVVGTSSMAGGTIRMWFDADTKRPVRWQWRSPNADGHGGVVHRAVFEASRFLGSSDAGSQLEPVLPRRFTLSDSGPSCPNSSNLNGLPSGASEANAATTP